MVKGTRKTKRRQMKETRVIEEMYTQVIFLFPFALTCWHVTTKLLFIVPSKRELHGVSRVDARHQLYS